MFESDDYDQVLLSWIIYCLTLIIWYVVTLNIFFNCLQLLSQLDFPLPEAREKLQPKSKNLISLNDSVNSSNTDQRKSSVETLVTYFQPNKSQETRLDISNVRENRKTKSNDDCPVSPTHVKRKILNSYFNHKSKGKFPGPAGLLTGSFEEKKDESICQMELLSQV